MSVETAEQRAPMRRVEAYLAALTDHTSRRIALRDTVAAKNPDTPDAAMAALHDALAGDHHGMDDPADQLGLCLLYTSPSPRDLSTSRMPSSA